MNLRRITNSRRLINLCTQLHTLRPLTTNPIHTTLPKPIDPTPNRPFAPVNPAHLLRVCTTLFQQQNSPDSRLQSNLQKTEFSLNHEFFLQVCNKFPLSWRPVYCFYKFTLTQPRFTHTPVTFNKMLDVIGKSRNIDLFWEVLHEMAQKKVASEKTFRIALKTLADARELKKCVEYFHLMNSHGYGYSIDTLNKVVETLCKEKLVDEARHVVLKLKDWIKPDGVTYKLLICGFCDVGDVIEASRTWNMMMDEGFEADIDAVNTMMERFFKDNQFREGVNLFQTMRVKRMEELGLSTYRIVIKWMCISGKLSQAHMVFDEMKRRGIQVDNTTLGSIIYGLVSKNRVREAYLMVENIAKPEISVYHALIRGLLKLRKADEATEVFREMIRKGCEPIMHTYIMLLQGHLGLLKLRKADEATEVFREMIRKGCEPIMHTYIMLLQGHLGKRGRKGSDPLVNFDSIFVGGLVKAGRFLEATKYVERTMKRGLEVPRFDYNKFLHYFSNEEGAVMFEEFGQKLREVGLFDLADIFVRYGEKMATRDRRRTREAPNELPMT